ncbi:MAG: VIT domain-containing protein [candidate division KSB1 bacterium]|nr:VIT domain-containing protein [candidate division KSB1 bacterium]
MRFKSFLFVFAAMLITMQGRVSAIGTIFSRPLSSDVTYNQMWIKSVDATAEVQGQIAVTTTHQVFRNEMNQVVEAVWIFPLPENAVVVELLYKFNNTWYKGAIKEREEARREYESRIRQLIDPALLESLGNNLYRLSIAPINPLSDVETKITYVELLPYEFGSVTYLFQMNAVKMSPRSLQRISFVGTFNSPKPYKRFTSPSHGGTTALGIQQLSEKSRRVVYGDENLLPNKDMRIEFETARSDVEVNVIHYTPAPEENIGNDSYYAVWITPPDESDPGEIIPKKIVFCADVSSSMEGVRIEQLKAALHEFLKYLQPQDYFNIITFGTAVTSFRPNLVPADANNIEEARAFITDIGALGLTNINDALLASLNQSFSDEFANFIVFMTDGYPTWGETFVPNIVRNVKKANTKGVHIFAFGLGDEVSKTLLTQIAVENGGYTVFINRDADLARIIGNHFQRMSRPMMTNLDIKIEGLVTSDRFPRPLPDLFWGNQVMQMGLYKNSGTFPVYLIGKLRNRQVSYVSYQEFPQTPGGHRFVPRLWAKAKINYLLDQIAVYGEMKELVDQVIELSLKFQILTPYTAFYADPNAKVKEKREARPSQFVLYPNHPNPFNPSTTLRFELPGDGYVTVRIYDLTGRLVRTVFAGVAAAGEHALLWDGCDDEGLPVAAGVYLCRLEFTDSAGERLVQTIKMSLVK